MSSITLKALSLAACFAVAGLSTLAQAAESSTPADKAEVKVEAKAEEGREARPANFMLNLRAAKALKLTDEQTSKIADLEKAHRDKVQELRKAAQADGATTGSEPGAGRAGMREAAQKLNAEFSPKLDAILTAEQKAELKTKIEEMMSQRGPRGEGRRGRPQTDEQAKPQ